MPVSRENLFRASFLAAFAAAVLILISISLSQTLLAISLALLFASRHRPLRVPGMWLPLALFLVGTLLALVFSPSPLHGLPQLRKMFVFSTLLVVSSAFSAAAAVRLFVTWGALEASIAIFGLAQFVSRLHSAYVQHSNIYLAYLNARFAGSMSLPITFAGQDMVVLLVLLAYVLFGLRPDRRIERLAASAGCGLIALVLLANGTRTVWLGCAAGGVWLLWCWKRWVAVLTPALLVILLWAIPGPVHDRFRSIFRPQQNVDSNEFRVICIKTGIRMIEAHPLLGIGLDETKYHFLDYLPADTPRPLPPGFYQHLHNFYLQYAAERGIPTLLMMIWMLLSIIRDFHRALARLTEERREERFLLYAGIATVIGIMVSGLFEVNLGDSEVLTVFLVVISCGYLAVDQTRRGQQARVQPASTLSNANLSAAD
ncbi:MAG TPA: O-antigen ligase family protein [Bryobacteraceae bacterium]|jgi:O-antigen ligase|nr:O-antigen ligase family protein [Bryobacteraceae bacterium]